MSKMTLKEEEFNLESTFKIMKTLCKKFNSRVAGSTQEQEAVKFIAYQFKKHVGSLPNIDNFPIILYEGKYASLQILPEGEIIEGKPIWLTKNTPSTGIIRQVVYIDLNNVGNISNDLIKNKIVILETMNDYLTPENFSKIKSIYDLEPAGVVILDYSQPEMVRSDIFFTEASVFSRVPTMIIPTSQYKFEKNQKNHDYKLLIFGEKNDEVKSSNVSIIIEGLKKDYILICAHHDTVENTQGARDNAAGVAIVLELARLLSKTVPNYTYRIITLGGEERGLEGMKQILDEYDISRVLLCINIDGVDSLPGKIGSKVIGDNVLYDMLKKISNSNSYESKAIQKTPNGGDNMELSRKGVPSIMLKLKGNEDTRKNHTELDKIDDFTTESLEKTGHFAIKVINKLESMEEVEFSNKIPDELKEETKNYFKRMKLYQE